MKYITLLLMIPLLSAGCVAEHSDTGKKVDRLIVPSVKQYTREQQSKAADEMDYYCDKTPTICGMINDFGKMRDEARIALGLKVDTKR